MAKRIPPLSNGELPAAPAPKARRAAKGRSPGALAKGTAPDMMASTPAAPMPPADGRTSVSMASEPSEEDIRMRAYHRYLERGGHTGHEFDDWLEAERELRKTD